MRSADGPERGRGEGREAPWTPARVEGKPRVAHRRSVTTSAQAAHPSPVCEHAVSLAPLRRLPHRTRFAGLRRGPPFALSRREQRAKLRSARKGYALRGGTFSTRRKYPKTRQRGGISISPLFENTPLKRPNTRGAAAPLIGSNPPGKRLRAGRGNETCKSLRRTDNTTPLGERRGVSGGNWFPPEGAARSRQATHAPQSMSAPRGPPYWMYPPEE